MLTVALPYSLPRSGYTGGDTEHPLYHYVMSGQTGHAESVQIEFDPKVVSYPELLEVFLSIHDPHYYHE